MGVPSTHASFLPAKYRTILIRHSERDGGESQKSYVMKRFVAPTCSMQTSVTRARHPVWGSGNHGLICACARATSYEGSGTWSETVTAAGRKERESVQCAGV